MAPSVERKLTTILSADVAGYSRLMSGDEAGTLATLTSYREIVAGLVADHRGRVVNTAGDSMLAEFPSVVNAVECAVRIQRALAERNATRAAERQMWLRIGINLGDVMVEEGDLFGDGVNVAARLQGLAEPGGILISGTVFDHVKDKLPLGFDYLGPQSIKNIPQQVPTWRVLLQPDAARPPVPDAPAPHPETASPAAAPSPWRRLYPGAATAGAVIALLFAINMLSYDGDLWFQWPTLGILFVFALRAIRLFTR
jgi:adenylate cyclase